MPATREDLRDLRDDRALLNEVAELRNQNDFMRSLVARLQEFLRLYQTRYPELQVHFEVHEHEVKLTQHSLP